MAFDDGLFRNQGNTNRSFTIFDAARDRGRSESSGRTPFAASGDGQFHRPHSSLSNGSGRLTRWRSIPVRGRWSLRANASVDDVGQPINPLILHGQVHGGNAQGVGQALCEPL